jgi:hypothetical protein
MHGFGKHTSNRVCFRCWYTGKWHPGLNRMVSAHQCVNKMHDNVDASTSLETTITNKMHKVVWIILNIFNKMWDVVDNERPFARCTAITPLSCRPTMLGTTLGQSRPSAAHWKRRLRLQGK